MLLRSSKEILEEFYELGEDRVAISLNDGSYYEGYMFEILEKTFTFLIGGPLAPDEPI